MSEPNAEIVRRGYEAYNRGDIDGTAADFAPDCEYIPSGALPGGRDIIHGPEEYKRYIGWLQSEFDDAHAEIHELVDAGDAVLASLTLRGRGRQSGAPVGWALWQVWTFQDGKVIRGEAFTSPDEAREAARLSE
jgi:ketosteroid isomerase-like protein